MQQLFDSIGQFLGPIGQVFHILFYLPVYNVLMVIYEGLDKIFPAGAFALAIIILTLIIRSALIPLTRKQLASTRKMQVIQPQLKALQQQYRGDPQTLMAEQRKLYKENGVSMYGGCLPLVVQMPFLYALYYSFFAVLSNHENLSDAAHLAKINNDLYPFIPHLAALPHTFFIWTSLAVPDTLHILPIIAALLTFIQMRMAMPVRKKPAPGENPDPTSQAMSTTQYIMPLVTLFFGWTFPAGLALYWCISTGFSAVQQYFINGNFGSLFVGVPGMERYVPEPTDITPTTTRAPAVGASAGAARAVVAESPPAEGGFRGWWNRLREGASAAQAQAIERADQARQARDAAIQERQQAAERDGTTGRAAPQRRQRMRQGQGPVLLRPTQPASDAESVAPGGDEAGDASEQAGATTTPEKASANGSASNGVVNGSSGKSAKPSASGANGANGANGVKPSANGASKANGSSGARTNANNANGTRSATTSGSNAARKNSAKGGSGGRSGGGRPKRR